jgi:hypothetical protein
MVGAVSFHTFRAAPAHDVTTADDYADLYAHFVYRFEHGRRFEHGFAADDGLLRGERLPADFDEYAMIHCFTPFQAVSFVPPSRFHYGLY